MTDSFVFCVFAEEAVSALGTKVVEELRLQDPRESEYLLA